MGLGHLVLPVEQIQTAGGEFSVRGLGFQDIIPIIERNREIASDLFAKLVTDDADVSVALDNAAGLAAALAKVAPGLVFQIIAAGADEDDLDRVKALPLPAQLEALEKIAKLTFAASSPKKVLEIVISVANGLSAAMTDLGPSLIGSGLFEAK